MQREALTRFEVARAVGLRALQLDAGAKPQVVVSDEQLKCDTTYVAAREIAEGKIDAIVKRADGTELNIRNTRMPIDLFVLLDTKDGRTRSPSVT